VVNFQAADLVNFHPALTLPFGRKVGKGLISETNANITNAENARMFKDEVYHVVEEELEIAGVKLKGFVLFSKKKESEEHQLFYRHLLDIEQVLEGMTISRGNPMQTSKDAAGRFASYFECTVQDRVLHLKRRQNAIAQAENRFGKMILLSSRSMAWDDVLSLYRQRDEAEKQFDQLKNELELLPLRIQKTVSLRGLLFIFFVALLIRMHLLNRAREAGLLARQSVDDIIFELSKLRAVSTGGRWMLTEVTKKVRTPLEKLKIPVPVGVST